MVARGRYGMARKDMYKVPHQEESYEQEKDEISRLQSKQAKNRGGLNVNSNGEASSPNC